MSFIEIEKQEDLVQFLDNFDGTYEISRKKKRSQKPYEGCNDPDFVLLTPEANGHNGFHARIRCDFGANSGMTYKDICAKWMKRLRDLTTTSWIVDWDFGIRKSQSRKHEQLTLHSERYLCQFSSKRKVALQDRKRDTSTLRNMNCRASITFKVYKVTRTMNALGKDGYYLNRPVPLSTEIELHWLHSHALQSGAPLTMRRITTPERMALQTQFVDSSTPSESLRKLKEIAVEKGDMETMRSQQFPSLNTVQSLYRRYKKENLGNKPKKIHVKNVKKKRKRACVRVNNKCSLQKDEGDMYTEADMSCPEPDQRPPHISTLRKAGMIRRFVHAAEEMLKEYFNPNEQDHINHMSSFIKCLQSIDSSEAMFQKMSQFVLPRDSLNPSANVKRFAPVRIIFKAKRAKK